MFAAFALTLTLATSPSSPSNALPAATPFAAQDPQLETKLAAAGKDVAKLLELAAACTASGQEEDARKVYAKVLELDAANEAAHKALRHQFYDQKWFESFAELAKYKREEAAKMKQKGLARFKDEWVPEGDVPFLSMGWTKDEKNAWHNPVVLAREKQIAEWKDAGYEFRADDNSWIAPNERDKWASLLWKCGEDWVDMAKANEFHAKPEQCWELAGEHFLTNTTIDWEGANLARWHADKTWLELVRIFGVEPVTKPQLFVLDSLEQYNLVAGTTPILPEFEGYSSLHGAYFADLYFEGSAEAPQFGGCGVSYWDRKDPKAGSWGPLWLRWAAAQSFVEGIDPSWSAVGETIVEGGAPGANFAAAFWAEKKIPRWLRYGAASYVERFEKDPQAAEGADPWTLRNFAFAELKKAGGLRKLDQIFAFGLDIKDIPGSSRYYEEAGLVVAFLLDGAPTDKDLAAKHEAFKAALKSGSKADVGKAAVALQKALAKHEKDIAKFAGL
ncbi:MAG: hypothetical protein IPJ19_18590 [Planctomycetes bacterium]|nr:hypothetical protein [Planctomycetota bacterium]